MLQMNRRHWKRPQRTAFLIVKIPTYFWEEVAIDDDRIKAEAIENVADLCCYRSFGKRIKIQENNNKTVHDFIATLLQILRQSDHSTNNILKIFHQLIKSDCNKTYISEHQNDLLLILMKKQWQLKSTYFIKLLTNILYELWLNEEIHLTSNQFKSFLLASLHRNSSEASKQSTLKFIVRTVTKPYPILKLFNDEKLLQLITDLSTNDLISKETRNSAVQCIYIAIKINTNIIDHNNTKLNALNIDSDIFDAINPYINTRLNKHFDELNWLQSLVVGRKLDAYSISMCHWKICTIINVITKNEFMMECEIHYDGLDDALNENKLISLITVMKNTILPLNTKTIFHQHFRPYNNNISICSVVNFENDKHKCQLCDLVICQCAVVKSPIQKNAYICRTCIVNYEKQQIASSIIDCNVELDIDSINIISEFAIGFDTFCCNQQQVKCKNKIEFNNTFEFMKHFDNKGKITYNYIPNQYNKLKALNAIPMHYKYFIATYKMRVFCSLCTTELKKCQAYDCNIKDTKMSTHPRSRSRRHNYSTWNANYCDNHAKCFICQTRGTRNPKECKACKRMFCWFCSSSINKHVCNQCRRLVC